MSWLLRPIYGVYAFFRRDAVNTSSYKLNFIFEIISMFMWALTMGTLGYITQGAQAPYMERYGNMNASTFLLVGMMCEFYLHQSQSMPQGIANPGAIERILLTPCGIPTFIFGTMSWGYFWNSINMAVYIIIGTSLFELDLSAINWPAFLAVLLLGVMAMWSLGIMAAGIQLVTKRWDPVTWFLMTFSMFISGVFYSPEVLLKIDGSGMLYFIAWCLPQTYVYHMVRLTFIGRGLSEMIKPLVNLLIIVAILFGLGWLTFKKCLRRCQLEGSLGWV